MRGRREGAGGLFDGVIANPPYRKIQARSAHRLLVRKLGLETSNLYTCFLACAIALCKPGAQPVAIIPRSWMNGPYFLPFRRWLMPNGCHVVLRRFTSKKKKRRVVPYLLEQRALAGALVGFENHLNVIHRERHGLDPAVVRALVAYLNSPAVDEYFRTFSGHTQVNATDLRRLRYARMVRLRKLGRDGKRTGKAKR